jgi:hypothetical protein
MKALACLFVVAGVALAGAAEPAWWTQQKIDCGLPSSLAYNDWVAAGCPCNRQSSGSGAVSGSDDPLVRAGAQMGTAIGDAIIRSFQAAAAERARRLQQGNNERRVREDNEAARMAEQKRQDALRKEQNIASLQGVLKFSDDDDTSPPAPPPKPKTDIGRVIDQMEELAKNQGWSMEKQIQLDAGLHKLHGDGDPDATDITVIAAWKDVLARGQDAALTQEAIAGGGLGFPGAGKQTSYQDCAIFALANATGLPYGVVAARATALINQGDWHTGAERKNPQDVIEKKGLTGGEVVMLAEAFGQAEVVPSKDFAATLRAGRPIMVNVLPPSGDLDAGHEVVLTKTFQHGNETWFVMMDSNQGPDQRLFVSKHELDTMLQENGVAYHADAGTTPQLLRGPGGS